MQKTQNYVITVIRVLSMMMIVICHIIKYYSFIPGSQYMGQFFDVGVQIFLLVSGYLYGGKTIDNSINWLYKRAKKICIPMIIVVVVDVAIMSMRMIKTDLSTCILYLLNLHGLSFLNCSYLNRFITGIDNLGPLWFTTIIMLCYSISPLLQRFRNKWQNNREYLNYCIVITVFLYTINAFLSYHRIIEISYFILFFVGYCMGAIKFNKDQVNGILYTALTVGMIILQILRMIIRLRYSTFPYYAEYVTVSQSILGIWMFYTAFVIDRISPILIRKMADTEVFNYLNSSSYYIYLVHGVFCRGTAFNVFLLTGNMVLNTLVFIVLTILTAALLRNLSEKIIRLL